MRRPASCRGAVALPQIVFRLVAGCAFRIDPSLRDRHDDHMLRRFLRDYSAAVQLAQAIAPADRPSWSTGKALVPLTGVATCA
jgi:hypothetical protein